MPPVLQLRTIFKGEEGASERRGAREPAGEAARRRAGRDPDDRDRRANRRLGCQAAWPAQGPQRAAAWAARPRVPSA